MSLVAVLSVGCSTGQHQAHSESTASVIVLKSPGAGSAPEQAVQSLGGEVRVHLGIIHGFSAQVPQNAIPRIAATSGVEAITPDRSVHSDAATYSPSTDKSSMYTLDRLTGAAGYWSRGYTGQGVDVALIDTGVAPVEGLSAPGKIINGPDLSFESQADNLRYLDSNGHGTFMAGIIAGKDSSVGSPSNATSDQFVGVAPDARIVSVKVGDAFGTTDTSQVIAGINWVVQHRNDPGMNIRVLNLSFGTDSTQSYTLDPLAYAAEMAWRRGIVVVASAGNDGYGSAALNDPALDPYVLAVGAVDLNGTPGHQDDTVPAWSSTGDGVRNPDLVAPGVSVVSLRDPGSQIDVENPGAVVANRFFRGSGTSQATAMVSGAVALLLQERPGITPDQVKTILDGSATKVPGGNFQAQGHGTVDLEAARSYPTQNTVQTWTSSTGLGTLEGSRGTAHLSADNVTLQGEEDIFAMPWIPSVWAPAVAADSSWNGGTWNGSLWTGSAWTTASWTGSAWGSVLWTRNSWSGTGWSRNSWSRNSWSRSSWSGKGWTSNRWSSNTFSRQTWSTNRWG
ncbi:MAG: S8 family serine peptidase [Actinomycetota bacterium]|nr:S8 family serine peptidase [Actinomycetota bacterium]